MDKNNIKRVAENNAKSLKTLQQKFIDTFWPYEKLKLDINKLDKVDLPAAKIASFLFKAQLVELELKGLLESIDELIKIKSRGFVVYRVLNLDYRKLGLGDLKKELAKYSNKSLTKLIIKLSLFKTKRNAFTHNLYLQNKDVNQLALEADKYKKYAEESLDLIKIIHNELWRSLS